LHLGSLYCAVASYLDARANSGAWIVRIEDLDRPREVAGAASRILGTLQSFGFEWDGEALRQSDREELYAAALRSLGERGLIFPCSCSRAQLIQEERYPGTCRERSRPPAAQTAIRLRVEPQEIQFTDRIQGSYRQDVAATVGDVILRRRDGLTAYQLAVVVDDEAQGITHVVRGADLLDNTPRQIYLQRALNMATPAYAHVPVLTEPDGGKLAKSRRSVRLDAGAALAQLVAVFGLLGLEPPPKLAQTTLNEAWTWAIARWDVSRVPRRLGLPAH
jgi:glutamyl-Q tRNA(Asp) synthetase